LRQRKVADDQINADEKLGKLNGDIETYIELVQAETNAEQREDVLKELSRELIAADSYIGELETQTLLSGENDHLNAIMTIKPGAGGTESQDWASILLRMYLRWRNAEDSRRIFWMKRRAKKRASKALRFSSAERMPYGLLAGETGVHRLVRISPFDQAARRHTSFGLGSFVIPEVDDRIEVNINPEDIKLDTFRSAARAART